MRSWFHQLTKKAPAMRPGLPSVGSEGSVAAVHEPPLHAPGRRYRAPHVAAAVAVAMEAVAADHEAGRAPSPMMPAAAPGRGGGRSQRRRTQRGRSNGNKREFA